tara:strand:- start:1767 stop:2168 length:402 start_codon:yes stop_codon:yes gene_type:complete
MRRIWLVLLPVGCEPFDAGQYAPDPGYPEPFDTGDVEPEPAIDCADTVEFNWVNFGKGFFTESCNGCHYSETPFRYGAPEYVVFDTSGDVWAHKGIVLAVAAGETPSMPPNGGTTDLDRLKLQIWLTCGEPGQ